MAQERRSTRRTGGGPPLRVEYTSYEEELRQIMPREIVEGINVQDTDSPSFAQGVDSPGPQLSPIPTATPPPSVRDSATEEQAGPSSYQAPQVESLQMSPEPDEQTIITLETVDAPVSGFQDVAPGPAEAPAHQQPAPQSMDPAREMAQSIGAFQQQQSIKLQAYKRIRRRLRQRRWSDLWRRQPQLLAELRQEITRIQAEDEAEQEEEGQEEGQVEGQEEDQAEGQEEGQEEGESDPHGQAEQEDDGQLVMDEEYEASRDS
ncbi:uncharacterized protein LOC142142526 [Mixophyes fleayi]|uniref:uncharacterized protein LOC142142526 n=1 Tax=Mixophyes fleayi TaxID=3061075 RepID=UPI003F4E33D1